MSATTTKTKPVASKLSKEQIAAVDAAINGLDSNQMTLVVRRVLSARKTVNDAARRVRIANEKARLEARLSKLSK
jgi:hypothetical protein